MGANWRCNLTGVSRNPEVETQGGTSGLDFSFIIIMVPIIITNINFGGNMSVLC